MTTMTIQERSDVSTHLITNDGGSSSNVETWGISLADTDEAVMQPVWTCGYPCKINKYDEDGNVVAFTAMNLLQMRDHLRNYHLEVGHTLFMPWVNDLFQRAKRIESQANQIRKAKEEKEDNELEEIKKEFGFA